MADLGVALAGTLRLGNPGGISFSGKGSHVEEARAL